MNVAKMIDDKWTMEDDKLVKLCQYDSYHSIRLHID